MILNLNNNHAYCTTRYHPFCSKNWSSTSLWVNLWLLILFLHRKEMIFILFPTGGIFNVILANILANQPQVMISPPNPWTEVKERPAKHMAESKGNWYGFQLLCPLLSLCNCSVTIC